MKTYTAEQVYDTLIRQGYDKETAESMAMAIGTKRVTNAQLNKGYDALGVERAGTPTGNDGKQDSNFLPNLTEGAAFAAALSGLNKVMPNKAGQPIRNKFRGVGRFALPGVAGALATNAIIAATDNNYYDRATTPQIVADLGGSDAGSMLGDKLGTTAAAKIASSRLGSLAGGRLGAAIGAAGGPIGILAGTALGTGLGYLLPKLLPDGSKSVAEDDGSLPDKEAGWVPLAMMAGAGGVLGTKGGRRMLNKYLNPFEKKN